MRRQLLYFLLCYPLSAYTQQIFQGTVIDATSGQPLMGVKISTKDSQAWVVTDSMGRFTLDMPPGEAIQAKYIGYEDFTGLPDKSGNILIKPNEQLLGTVVISATMRPVSKDLSPIPVEIYHHRFFQKQATATLFEALTAVNGVRPQINCNVCNTGDIHINGMEGPYTMVTIDGMPIMGGLATVYGLTGIPNGLIDRVEVVKGPAGILYGSEAVGGMLNIITKNALTAPRFYADIFRGSNRETSVDLGVADRWGKFRQMLGVNYYRMMHPMDINNDQFTDLALQHRISVFNKWAIQRPSGQIASLAWRYVYEDRWGGELRWTPQWRGSDSIYGESVYTNRFEIFGKYPFSLKNLPFQLDFSWNSHDQNAVYGTTRYLGRQQIAFTQLSTQIQWRPQLEALAGLAIRHTYYDDNTPATQTQSGNAPDNAWLPGIFFQQQWQANRRNTLLAGLRYDYHSVHKHILTPRISWKWSEQLQHTLRLTGGSGYRVANIFTEDHAALSGAREVVLSEKLLPERSWNLNLQYTRKFYPKHMGFWGFDLSFFYTYFNNQILPDYNTDPNKIIYQNLRGHAVSRGAALNLDLNFLNGVKIIGGLTAMDVYRNEGGEKHPQLFAAPLSGSWTMSWPVKDWNITMDYTGNFSAPMPLPVLPNDPRPSHSPWFALHHVQLTWQLKSNLELYSAIKNLFGFYPREEVILRAFDPFDKYIDQDNPLGLSFDPTYNYAPIQRQRWLIGLRMTINNDASTKNAGRVPTR